MLMEHGEALYFFERFLNLCSGFQKVIHLTDVVGDFGVILMVSSALVANHFQFVKGVSSGTWLSAGTQNPGYISEYIFIHRRGDVTTLTCCDVISTCVVILIFVWGVLWFFFGGAIASIGFFFFFFIAFFPLFLRHLNLWVIMGPRFRVKLWFEAWIICDCQKQALSRMMDACSCYARLPKTTLAKMRITDIGVGPFATLCGGGNLPWRIG